MSDTAVSVAAPSWFQGQHTAVVNSPTRSFGEEPAPSHARAAVASPSAESYQPVGLPQGHKSDRGIKTRFAYGNGDRQMNDTCVSEAAPNWFQVSPKILPIALLTRFH
jgi:hypothetical protein